MKSKWHPSVLPMALRRLCQLGLLEDHKLVFSEEPRLDPCYLGKLCCDTKGFYCGTRLHFQTINNVRSETCHTVSCSICSKANTRL